MENIISGGSKQPKRRGFLIAGICVIALVFIFAAAFAHPFSQSCFDDVAKIQIVRVDYDADETGPNLVASQGAIEQNDPAFDALRSLLVGVQCRRTVPFLQNQNSQTVYHLYFYSSSDESAIRIQMDENGFLSVDGIWCYTLGADDRDAILRQINALLHDL
jgi:hypothetical protein